MVSNIKNEIDEIKPENELIKIGVLTDKLNNVVYVNDLLEFYA